MTTMSLIRKPSSRLAVVAAVVAAAGFVHQAQAQTSVTYDCDPCIFREDYTVQFFSSSSGETSNAAQAVAGDMGVNFGIEQYGDQQNMADGITAAAAGDSPPNAMVVSMRGANVLQAVKGAADNNGVPAIGIDTASLIASASGMVGAVGLDDADLGTYAAETMLSLSQDQELSDVVFVSVPIGGSIPRKTSDAWSAFSVALIEAGAQPVDANYARGDAGDDMTSISVNATISPDPQPNEEELFTGCPDGVVVSHPLALADVRAELAAQECETTIVGVILPGGSYDNEGVFTSIRNGEYDFAVGQLPGNQGVMGTIMATLYATTGLALSPNEEDDNGRYIVKPVAYTTECLTAGNCLGLSPPVVGGANATAAPDAAAPAVVKIGGVSHGVDEDSFWDPVYAAANQAAIDMQVELDFERFSLSEMEEGSEQVAQLMDEKIRSLCGGDNDSAAVQGLFVSLPNDGVLDAVRFCESQGIPIIVTNTGYWFSANAPEDEDSILNFVGQRDSNAGAQAGEKLAGSCRGCAFFCLNHAPGIESLTSRCSSFGDSVTGALESNTFPVEPYVEVSPTNSTQFVLDVEAAVDASDSARGDEWNRVALLVNGGQPSIVEAILALKERHPGVTVGAFDLSEALYEALEQESIVFGIDQQPYRKC